MTLSTPPPSEQEIENYMRALPRMQMSARGDEMFFSRLSAALLIQQSATRTSQSVDQERSGFLTGFRRFSFSFGLGVFAVGVAFTAISYQDSITRGSLFYPWKQSAEKVEGRLAFSTEQNVNTELRFADRRLREAWNIIGEAPQTAFVLINTAYAANDLTSTPLDNEKAIALRETLSEMNEHVNKASQFVESAPLDAEAAVSLLDTIAHRADAQVTSLKNMKKKTPTQSRFAVSAAAHSQESYVVSVVVAREEIRSLMNRNGPKSIVRLTDFSKLVSANFITESNNTQLDGDESDRANQARNVLSALEKKMNGLPANDRAIAQARVVEAQRALDDGKTATAFGLSIAITKQLAQENNNASSQVATPQIQLLPQASVSTGTQVQVRTQPAHTNVLELVEQIPTGPSVRTNVGIPTAVQNNPTVNVQNSNNRSVPTVITPSPYVFAPSVQIQATPNVQIQNPVQVAPVNRQPVITQPVQTIAPQPQVHINVPVQNNPTINVQPQQVTPGIIKTSIPILK